MQSTTQSIKWSFFVLIVIHVVSNAQEDCNCQNGGSCRNNETACECLEGTSGAFCESCDCQNGGTCSPEGCQCRSNTFGKFCEVFVCDCLHGGICSGEPPICQCPSGTSGDKCERLEECECLNGGTCRTDGEAPCNCPPGTTGDMCETFELCGAEACQNDSPCVTTSDGSSYCDCRMITIHDPKKHYAGQFCQFQATMECGADAFCVNGGVCRDQEDGTFSCDCPADWTGPTCEIKNIVLNCTKTCLNGGECHKIGDTDSDALDRCLCPKGFAGMRCEHSYQECGTGELMCLHGTQCVAPQGELQPDWTCECKQGQSCQRHQSSVCTSSDVDTSVYRGMTSLMYCINDGVCITYEQQGKRYPACQCPPQYMGPHCEFLRSQILAIDTLVKPKDQSAASIFTIFVACILFAVLLVVLNARRRRQRSKEKTAIITEAHREADRKPMMEVVDFELEDVELL